MKNIPILMLHAIGNFGVNDDRVMCISEERFVQLLDLIEAKGMQTTTFAGIQKNQYPTQPIIISFDDCYSHLFDFAIPELQRRKMTAVFYAPVAHLGSYNSWDHDLYHTPKLDIMSMEQLLTLQNLGMEIGSHGNLHVDLTQHARMCQLEALGRSKMVLEEFLKTAILSFAWPYGQIPKGYQTLMRKAGYSYGVGIYRAFENEFTLRRIGIHESDTPKTISRKLTRSYLWMRKLLDLKLSLKS